MKYLIPRIKEIMLKHYGGGFTVFRNKNEVRISLSCWTDARYWDTYVFKQLAKIGVFVDHIEPAEETVTIGVFKTHEVKPIQIRSPLLLLKKPTKKQIEKLEEALKKPLNFPQYDGELRKQLKLLERKKKK